MSLSSTLPSFASFAVNQDVRPGFDGFLSNTRNKTPMPMRPDPNARGA